MGVAVGISVPVGVKLGVDVFVDVPVGAGSVHVDVGIGGGVDAGRQPVRNVNESTAKVRCLILFSKAVISWHREGIIAE